MRSLLLALLLAPAAFATTVTLERDAATVKGEVCRFKAGDRENPFKRWLTSTELTCVASDAAVEFPKGLWNVFGRTGDAISPSVLVDGDKAPERLTLTLRAASLLTVPASSVVYAPSLATAWPASGGRVLVPGSEPVWVMVLEKGKLVAVDDKPAIVGWLTATMMARPIPTPSLRYGSKNSDVLPPLERINGSFFRIKEPEAGEGEIRVEGRGWMPARKRVKVEQGLTIVPEAIALKPSGSLTVSWSTNQDLVALEESLGACTDRNRSALIEIVVSHCTAPDADSCAAIHTEPFPPELRYGSFTLDDLLPGNYRAELRFGRLPVIVEGRGVPPAEPARLSLHAFYEELYGSLTRGGQPLGENAEIVFGGAKGFAGAEKSEYRAIMTRPLDKDAQITVDSCDTDLQAIVLTDQKVRPRTRYDIDIPDNELTITIFDTFTREPLRGTVKIDVMSIDLPRRVVMTRDLKADEEGKLVVKFVPERELRISASAGGYQRQNVQPFTLGKTEKKEIEIQLVPLRGARGKFVSARPFERAFVHWYAQSGRETEQAEVAPDGTFVYNGKHGPDESMTLVSTSHPLWVTRSPQLDYKSTPSIPFPDAAPVRTFEVGVPDRTMSYVIGLAIGGIRVPHPPLRNHQQLRKESISTVRGGLRFRDIAETGPIDVLLGPPARDVYGGLDKMDFFALPAFIDVPRKRLGAGATSVVFE